jgi:hypothetical protein
MYILYKCLTVFVNIVEWLSKICWQNLAVREFDRAIYYCLLALLCFFFLFLLIEVHAYNESLLSLCTKGW